MIFKNKALKELEQTWEIFFFVIPDCGNLSNHDTKVKVTKEKTDKFNYIRTEHFFVAKKKILSIESRQKKLMINLGEALATYKVICQTS